MARLLFPLRLDQIPGRVGVVSGKLLRLA